MLNTFENSERFHARRLERQRHLENMDTFARVVGSGDAATFGSMADALSGYPLAKKGDEPIPSEPRNKCGPKFAYALIFVSVMLIISMVSLIFAMKLKESTPSPTNETSSVPPPYYVRYHHLFSLILDWGLTPRDRLEDSARPQARALDWLTTDAFSTENPEFLRTRFALATLFFGTQNTTAGLTWTRRNNWLSSFPVCFWYGVTCINGDVSVGLVAGLNLSSNGLSNALADEIGLLGLDIRSMDLGNNAIGGRLPETLSKLENLEDLYLGPNLFTSTLPSSFSQLNRLASLYINDCVLTGSIPTELSNLSNLLALGLHENQLSGTIPGDLNRLTALAVLYLDENLLTGSIPLLPHSLVDLRLSQNSLRGSIHDDIGNLHHLQVCYLDTNGLSGKLPENAIGALTLLHELHLFNNDFSGSIPTTIGNLDLLRVLYLDGNGISSSIPHEVGGMGHLESLYLYDNNISGFLPKSLGNLSNLQQLRVGFNQIGGSIPEQLGILSNLRVLLLSNNSFTGSIPESFSGLTSLARLELHGNNLTGGAPIRVCLLANYLLRDFTADCSMENMEIECTCCSRCYHD